MMPRSGFAIIVAILVLTHIAPAAALEPWRDTRSAEIRAMAETLTPALVGERRPWQIALALRSQVHRNAARELSGVPHATTAKLTDWPAAYRLSLVTRERTNSCNGLAILYLAALRSYAIPARMVALYFVRDGAAAPAWSHASVDVMIDGKWVAMDPTANVSLRDGAGRLLSWREALARAREGEIVRPMNDGQPVARGYTWSEIIQSYGYDLADFARQSLLGPWQGGGVEDISEPAWDGLVHRVDGLKWDAKASLGSDFYRRLADPRDEIIGEGGQ